MGTQVGAVLPPAPPSASDPGWRERRRRRQRLARQDRLVAHLAELRRIGELVVGARAVVASGWVQGSWLVHRDDRGGLREGGAPGRPVSAACLVGAVVHTAGGVGALDSQPVQRALDLTWHALHGDPQEPVRWCPTPPVRVQHVRDLARWNDATGRTRDEVVALLRDAERLAGEEAVRARAAAGLTAAAVRPPG
jgi:hypothetical protein